LIITHSYINIPVVENDVDVDSVFVVFLLRRTVCCHLVICVMWSVVGFLYCIGTPIENDT